MVIAVALYAVNFATFPEPPSESAVSTRRRRQMIKPVRPVGPTELDRAECIAVRGDVPSACAALCRSRTQVRVRAMSVRPGPGA